MRNFLVMMMITVLMMMTMQWWWWWWGLMFCFHCSCCPAQVREGWEQGPAHCHAHCHTLCSAQHDRPDQAGPRPAARLHQQAETTTTAAAAGGAQQQQQQYWGAPGEETEEWQQQGERGGHPPRQRPPHPSGNTFSNFVPFIKYNILSKIFQFVFFIFS